MWGAFLFLTYPGEMCFPLIILARPVWQPLFSIIMLQGKLKGGGGGDRGQVLILAAISSRGRRGGGGEVILPFLGTLPFVL